MIVGQPWRGSTSIRYISRPTERDEETARPTPLAPVLPLDPNPPRRAFSATLEAATLSPPLSLVPVA